jgi:protein-disulfide isomerase
VNDKNPEGKRTARDRLAAEREQHSAREKRRRTLIVGAAVTCVLGLAAVAGVLAANADQGGGKSDSAGPVVPPKGAAGKGQLAVPVGDEGAGATLTVWEDFRCPACKQFEDGLSPTVHELAAAGKLKAEYHLVTLIDHNMGGAGSLHAANAAACAQDAGRFREYHDVLYANQPRETEDTYADNAALLRLAGKVPGLDTAVFRKCVTSGTHSSWVEKSDRAFQDAKLSGTPTVLLDGRSVFGDREPPLTPARLRSLVDQADRS